MKKIFAIALALVMVLSMASAFAMTCGTIDWSCATTTYNCGTATVEVVPYVVANACDGKGTEYVESSCAGAVYDQMVYYAIKVNVPADINEEWFAAAEMTVKLTGLTGEAFADYALTSIADDDFGEKALTYYLYYAGGEWNVINANADGFKLSTVVQSAKVTDAKTAKVCAKLTSKVTAVGSYVEVADYKIAWRSGKIIDVWNGKTGNDSKQALFTINSSDKIEKVTFKAGTDEYTLTDFGFLKADGSVTGYCAPFDWLKAVMDYFKLDFRNTCYTEKAFKANFGWDNKVESCFTWSSNATAVVDADCVVAIPKTGDVSVVAYAVMAVVAAAGTMLKK